MADFGLSWRSWRKALPFSRARAAEVVKPAIRASGPAVVDCAVYVSGQREPLAGEGFAAALAQASSSRGFVWLGLFEPTAAEMVEAAEVFGLHELAVEDTLLASHRPKVERYGEITFIIMRTAGYVEHAELTAQSEIVETGVIMLFVAPQFVVSIRHGAPGALAKVRSDLEATPDRLALGPWAVAHAVADRLVDIYLKVCDQIESDMDAVEEMVFGLQSSANIAQIYQLKRELMEFRRAVVPLQRPLAELPADKELMPKPLRSYFRDVNENLARVADRIAAFNDLLTSVTQARLAQVGVDQTRDMRKIAAWAAIAALQTAIAGIYGMNFDIMPELDWRYGYPVVLAIMATAGYGLYRMFRRSGWL